MSFLDWCCSEDFHPLISSLRAPRPQVQFTVKTINLPANVTRAAQETLDAATALLDPKGFDASATLDMDDAKLGDQLRYAVWREQRYGGGEITWNFYAEHGGAEQKANDKAPVRNPTAASESESADRAEDASPKRWWVWRIRFNCVNTLRRSCWAEIPGSWLVS